MIHSNLQYIDSYVRRVWHGLQVQQLAELFQKQCQSFQRTADMEVTHPMGFR